MATLNVQNLLVEINKKIVQTSDNEELLMLSRAVSVLKTGAIFTVGTFANLPDASENVGKLYFVENDGILYFSVVSNYNNIEYWAPITNGLQFTPLFSWGSNASGRLGNATAPTTSTSSPGTIITTNDGGTWCQIFNTVSSSAGIKTNGTLWTWGNNNQGRLGDGTTLNRCSPGTVAGGGTNWCQISSYDSHMSAVKCDGTIWTWGCGCCGALGDGTTLDRCSPGTVAGGGNTWCEVSSGLLFNSAIKTDGTIWTWGCNIIGQLGDGTTVSRSSPGTVAGGGTDWCQVSSGSNFTAAIKTNGTMWTWGCNCCGKLATGDSTNRSSPGSTFLNCTLWCQVSVGEVHGAALRTNGTLWAWGYNGQGRLGDGTTTTGLTPQQVAGAGTTWCDVSASSGSRHTAAIKTDGTIWTWGCNNTGQLGDGTTVSRCSPGTVAGTGNTWWKIAVANVHTAAIQRETL